MLKWLLAASLFLNSYSSNATEFIHSNNPEKIISISVNEKGFAIIGRDTMFIEQLTDEIQKRLWKSYLGTGEMFDAIRLEFSGNPKEETKKNARKAIQEGQKKALIDISLQKHKRLFEDLNSRKQRKIKNQFPVLFQQDY
ncbi:MAG: hypothetical protein ABUT20_01780 [Bacteroidota bacterium]